MADSTNGAVPLEDVLEAERNEIDQIRWQRMRPPKKPEGPAVGVFNQGDPRKSADAPHAPVSGGLHATHTPPEWWSDSDNDHWRDAIKRAHAKNYVGLAFSGGGIRSATFNLGVLQALADLKLLFRADYLSTVSGGGYIGAWLAAWTKRRGSFAEVQEKLAPNRVHQKEDREPTPIRFLRIFSNYLTPKLGFFSGDTWAMVGIYVRNLLLNQTIVLAMLAALLLFPRVALRLAFSAQNCPNVGMISMIGGALLLLVAIFCAVNNREVLEKSAQKTPPELSEQIWVLMFAAGPLFVTAVLGALWLAVRMHVHPHAAPLDKVRAICVGSGAYAIIWTVALLAALIYRPWLGKHVASLFECYDKWIGNPSPKRQPVAQAPRPSFLESILEGGSATVFVIASAATAGALAGYLYAFLSEKAAGWSLTTALTAGVPLVVGIFLLAGTLHIGLMGNAFRDRDREWWGRLGGWLMLWALVWGGIFWVALCLPDFLRTSTLVRTAWSEIAAKYLTPAWILSTAGSVLAGNSSASGKPGSLGWKDFVARIGPYVFGFGLLGWVSWIIQAVKEWQPLRETLLTPVFPFAQKFYWWVPWWVGRYQAYWAFGICVAFAFFMAWRVDINQFSMHLFYRNRLVRCYLGASNKFREPNRFTGFDRNDDIALVDFAAGGKDLPYDGPYPVLNMSLNLVKGKDLAWQERKAESFVMTPRYCGYDVWLEDQDSPLMRGERRGKNNQPQGAQEEIKILARRRCLHLPDRFGYRPTKYYAFSPNIPRHGHGHGPDLGLAMGISGAAVSPNMGYYSTPAVGFLLAVFNVRLGQWLGNPRHPKTWERPSPRWGLTYMTRELLGGTDDEAGYVYLSDGGHFDNMGLYELVKRRCGLIILGDAEADPNYKFDGLGGAIRKIRVDLGIDIDLDLTDLIPPSPGQPSKSHCALGTIHYENVDLEAPKGKIIYFKSSLTGDEPSDIKNFSKLATSFPHDSTVNQWFSESRFESYRKLGYHAVLSTICPCPDDQKGDSSAAVAATAATAKPSGTAAETAKQHLDAAVESGVNALREAGRAFASVLSPSKEGEKKPESLDESIVAALNAFGFDLSEVEYRRGNSPQKS